MAQDGEEHKTMTLAQRAGRVSTLVGKVALSLSQLLEFSCPYWSVLTFRHAAELAYDDVD
jgi:hypothetical protein